MTVKELKESYAFCRNVEESDHSDETTTALLNDSVHKLNEAREKIYKSMNKRKALVVCDYIFTDLKIEQIADMRHYADRTIKRFIKEADELLKAL